MRPRDEAFPWWSLVVALGLGLAVAPLVAAAVVPSARYILDNPFWFGLLVGPAVGIVYGGVWLRRSDVDADLHASVVGYILGGTLALSGVIVVIGFARHFETGTMQLQVRSFLLAGGVGGVSGLLVGANQVKAVTNARRVARERATMDAVERERETLEFLNEVLRHHVLNGMQIIRGYAELAGEEAGNEDVAHRTEMVSDRSDAIIELVRNVRALVQVEHEAPDRTPVSLDDVVSSEIAAIRETFPHATIENAVPAGVQVSADSLLSIVVENLLRNAIVHNDGDPHVRVTASVDDEMVTLVVADDGPGVPPERRDVIFDRTEAGAGGLGLYLVDRLVTRYGGDVRVTESALGGAEFVVRLPRATQAATSPSSASTAWADGGVDE